MLPTEEASNRIALHPGTATFRGSHFDCEPWIRPNGDGNDDDDEPASNAAIGLTAPGNRLQVFFFVLGQTGSLEVIVQERIGREKKDGCTRNENDPKTKNAA